MYYVFMYTLYVIYCTVVHIYCIKYIIIIVPEHVSYRFDLITNTFNKCGCVYSIQ